MEERNSSLFAQIITIKNDLKRSIILSGSTTVLEKSNEEKKILEFLTRKSNAKRVNVALSKFKFQTSFDWQYLLSFKDENIEINDWCSLWWENGLKIHFELMSIRNAPGNSIAHVDFFNEQYIKDYFFEKRRMILQNFCDGAFLNNTLNEDFVANLTDINLTPLFPAGRKHKNNY